MTTASSLRPNRRRRHSDPRDTHLEGAHWAEACNANLDHVQQVVVKHASLRKRTPKDKKELDIKLHACDIQGRGCLRGSVTLKGCTRAL